MRRYGLILAGLLAGFVWVGAVWAATFGNTNQEATNQTTGTAILCKFTAPAENGTISSISIYVASPGTSTVRVAIYSDVAGAPVTKLAESTSATTVTTAGWYTTNISYTFTANTVYWLGMFGNDGTFQILHGVGGTNQVVYDAGATFPTWPDPWTAVTYLAWINSIYATYTPASGTVRHRSKGPF